MSPPSQLPSPSSDVSLCAGDAADWSGDGGDDAHDDDADDSADNGEGGDGGKEGESLVPRRCRRRGEATPLPSSTNGLQNIAPIDGSLPLHTRRSSPHGDGEAGNRRHTPLAGEASIDALVAMSGTFAEPPSRRSMASVVGHWRWRSSAHANASRRCAITPGEHEKYEAVIRLTRKKQAR